MLIINDTLGAYGGGQTLILRMCEWLCENAHKVIVLCDNADNKEVVSALQKIGVEIIVIDIYDFEALAILISKIKKNETVKVINFAWNQYLSLEIAKSKMGIEFDNFIYCIHPQTFMKGAAIGIGFIRRHLVLEYGEILNRINDNKALLMMDEIDWKTTEDYFGRRYNIRQPIIRIPMIIEADVKKEIIMEQGYCGNVIFTSARAEFPFKGYIIGLIDIFEDVLEKYPNSKLVIVSGGNDYAKIEQRIEKCTQETQSAITLYKWMEYNKLMDVMKKSKLVVGMGTTILDASRVYKPSIPVCPYTMKCHADGYFENKPKNIAAVNGHVSVKDLINNVLKMSWDEYKNHSENSFRAVKELYDIDKIMPKIISMNTLNKRCILKRKEIIEHELANIYRKLRYGEKREFDYKRIQKEN